MPLRKIEDADNASEPADDTEGHRHVRIRFGEAEHTATEPADDTEGHRIYSDERIKHDVEPVALPEPDQADTDDTDDTEGHKRKLRFVAPAGESDDTDGHRFYSDERIKHNVEPVSSPESDADDTDDTEGHGFRGG